MEKLYEARLAKGLTQEQLGKLVGLQKSAISKYEKGRTEPDIEIIKKLANVLDTTTDYLLGYTIKGMPQNVFPMPKTKRIPLLGAIACGEPITAEENIEGYIKVNEDIDADFCLRCIGDSMINARIFDGDIVFIKQDVEVRNGEIAAVLIGDEATLKRIYLYPNELQLRAENPTYPTLTYKNEELEEIRILGKATHFLSKVK